MFSGMFMFSIGNVLIKFTSVNLPVIEVLFFRGILSVFMLLGFLLLTNKICLLKSNMPSLQAFRGIIGFISGYFLFLSFDLLPLTDATAISFASPLFITMLSIPLLKEKISTRLWVAIVIGFAGVSYLAHPTGQVTFMGAAAALISAFLEGLIMVVSRMLSNKGDAPLASVFYHTFFIGTLAAFFVPFSWVAPNWTSSLQLFGIALTGTLGQLFVVLAYKYAPAAVVAPVIYTLIIWSGIFGYIFWGEKPDLDMLLGLPIVVLSGLYIILQELKEDNAPKKITSPTTY